MRPMHLPAVVLTWSLPLVLGACSGSADGTAPAVQPGPPANTPAIPTVANPLDQLPAKSAELVADQATLSNFSPEITAAPFVDLVNDHRWQPGSFPYALFTIQLDAGRYALVRDGEACYPEGLTYQVANFNRQSLVTTECAPCFQHLVDFDDGYYYVSREPSTWWVADMNCRLAGGNLASITSLAEHQAVFAALAANNTRDAWIGLNDWPVPDSWQWRSGEPVAWTNWMPYEPNNWHGEFFAHFGGSVDPDGRWNDADANLFHYVLEVDAPLPELGTALVPALIADFSPLHLGEYGLLETLPVLERRLYWKKVFQTTIDAGASYTEEHTYTRGTSEATGMSFGWSVGVSTSLGWGPCSAEISAEFHSDFNKELTVSEEQSITKAYQLTAPAGKSVVLALWQLRERYVITDYQGQPWTDPQYELAGALPELDQGLSEEYVQTLYFDR